MAALSQFAVGATIPPSYARPVVPGSMLFWPQPTGFDGMGRPCGAVGKPYFIGKRRYITQAGHEWWADLFSSALDYYSVAIEDISIYDQRTSQMVEFATGLLLFPKWDGENPGQWYENYTIEIRELVLA